MNLLCLIYLILKNLSKIDIVIRELLSHVFDRRNYDIIILNETWNNKLNISGYNENSNMRTNQRDGGVAILIKECFEIKILHGWKY